jgi:hypothetical protein
MKPHVICLMTSSVDGRTLHSRWRPKGAGAALFEEVHDELAGDAWLVGRVTGQEFAKGKRSETMRNSAGAPDVTLTVDDLAAIAAAAPAGSTAGLRYAEAGMARVKL